MLHAALSHSERDRAAFLLQACAGDVALRREVELLLAQQASMGGFLEDPPVATVGPMDSKSLADIAVRDPQGFARLVESARSAGTGA
jgi:hypothetical protein